MTSDMWAELEAQVEAHGPNSIVFRLANSDDVELEVIDVKWFDETIEVLMTSNH